MKRLLDLTRLVSRAARPLTGVDRVEFAYLDHLVTLDGPLFGIVRSSVGYILLDKHGCATLRDKIRTNTWGHADWLSRLSHRRDPDRARAESDMRRVCLARCRASRLGRMLARHLPKGVHYINVGQSRMTRVFLDALGALEPRIAVMIHDTIPIDFPQYQRPDTIDKFREFLDRTVRTADLILCNSQQTERDVLRFAAPAVPATHVALLGVDRPVPGPAPQGPWTGQPYFVTLGTIEPRKNHALLLDLWQDIPDAHLLICGQRGWSNEKVFARLDARPPRVHELPGLSDADVFGLIAGAAGFLFPSFTEGYGLPPVEAAALDVPVLVNDLPIYREILGDIPIYAKVTDRYRWRDAISNLVDERTKQPTGATKDIARFTPPSWEAHFKSVLRLI